LDRDNTIEEGMCEFADIYCYLDSQSEANINRSDVVEELLSDLKDRIAETLEASLSDVKEELKTITSDEVQSSKNIEESDEKEEPKTIISDEVQSSKNIQKIEIEDSTKNVTSDEVESSKKVEESDEENIQKIEVESSKNITTTKQSAGDSWETDDEVKSSKNITSDKVESSKNVTSTKQPAGDSWETDDEISIIPQTSQKGMAKFKSSILLMLLEEPEVIVLSDSSSSSNSSLSNPNMNYDQNRREALSNQAQTNRRWFADADADEQRWSAINHEVAVSSNNNVNRNNEGKYFKLIINSRLLVPSHSSSSNRGGLGRYRGGMSGSTCRSI
jgi:hypothetical protein